VIALILHSEHSETFKMETYKVTNENELRELIEVTDAQLQTEGAPIHARPFHAASRISQRFGFGENLKLFVADREPVKGVYLGDDLTIRINRWYKQKYGERLKVDPSKRIPILIRQDVYALRIPLICGTVDVIWDPEQFGTTPANSSGGPVLNLVDQVEGFTKEYARSLTDEERADIADKFHFGFLATDAIYAAPRKRPIPEAIGDLEASLMLVLTRPPNYGISKWESLQATEKFIKALITKLGATFKFIHELNSLAAIAESAGAPTVPRSAVSKIQCSAGVRYGSPAVTMQEAVEAHQSALEVCGLIARSL